MNINYMIHAIREYDFNYLEDTVETLLLDDCIAPLGYMIYRHKLMYNCDTILTNSTNKMLQALLIKIIIYIEHIFSNIHGTFLRHKIKYFYPGCQNREILAYRIKSRKYCSKLCIDEQWCYIDRDFGAVNSHKFVGSNYECVYEFERILVHDTRIPRMIVSGTINFAFIDGYISDIIVSGELFIKSSNLNGRRRVYQIARKRIADVKISLLTNLISV